MEAQDQQPPVGDLFERVYLERGAPLQDKASFRNRLGAFIYSTIDWQDHHRLAGFLTAEIGVFVPPNGAMSNWSKFFAETKMITVLSCITVIWRWLRQEKQRQEFDDQFSRSRRVVTTFKEADSWLAFVARAMREENMAYRVDEKCGVHPFIDQEFERNRVSAVAALAAARYEGARSAFEAAHAYLESDPPDTKAAVRSAFEAIEIVARLIEPTAKNLNSWMVQNKLKPLAAAKAKDKIEEKTIDKVFEGFASLVDGLHNYRHGQGEEQIIAPTMTLAVYVLSSSASVLRWFVELDR